MRTWYPCKSLQFSLSACLRTGFDWVGHFWVVFGSLCRATTRHAPYVRTRALLVAGLSLTVVLNFWLVVPTTGLRHL